MKVYRTRRQLVARLLRAAAGLIYSANEALTERNEVFQEIFERLYTLAEIWNKKEED